MRETEPRLPKKESLKFEESEIWIIQQLANDNLPNEIDDFKFETIQRRVMIIKNKVKKTGFSGDPLYFSIIFCVVKNLINTNRYQTVRNVALERDEQRIWREMIKGYGIEHVLPYWKKVYLGKQESLREKLGLRTNYGLVALGTAVKLAKRERARRESV